MEKGETIKADILRQLHEIIDDKMNTILRAIEFAKESRDSDTKSSAGDKYETARAMMHIELEKNGAQLNKYQMLKKELVQIDEQRKFAKVEFGSLVITNQHTYFISIGLGKVEAKKESAFCISLASPMGKLLRNKVAGDKIQFRGKDISIVDIL